MSDSLQQIINDAKDRRAYCLATARTDEWVSIGKIVERLEALQKQPVAWMNPNPIASWDEFCTKQQKEVWFQANANHTIPLYK